MSLLNYILLGWNLLMVFALWRLSAHLTELYRLIKDREKLGGDR